MTQESTERRIADLAHAAGDLAETEADPRLRQLLAELKALAELIPPAVPEDEDESVEQMFDNLPV